MYGTIAEIRARPGKEDQMLAHFEGLYNQKAAGAIAIYLYRMDADPANFYLIVLFENKQDYTANANSPEEQRRNRDLLELLEGPPEWHDGEVVQAVEFAYGGL